MTHREICKRSLADDTRLPAELDPLLRRIYAARGVSSVAELDLGLQSMVPVGRLHGLAQAVDLLLLHQQRAAPVVVVGDFDADGATSAALVVQSLRDFGFVDVSYLVPNRFEYGYGLTEPIVDLACEREPGLIITVDNGISSHQGVQAAVARGVDVLITDHHLPGERLPEATAILNPNLEGDGAEGRNLAGVGVAFYLMAALGRRLHDLGAGVEPSAAARYLDLVALGTVADLVPLDHNNRVLVSQGLRRIRARRCRPGIQALLREAGRCIEFVTTADLGYAVAPRLNAAGRLTDMSVGIECLLAEDPAVAARLAAQLGQLNQERRTIEARMRAEALEVVDRLTTTTDGSGLPAGICLFDEGWHQGIVGLVASHVKERVHRPVVAFANADEETLKGSARSVSGFHARDALAAIATRQPGLIDKFGGHAMAAGLSLARRNYDQFTREFDAEVSRHLSPSQLRGQVLTDGPLAATELTIQTALRLRDAAPWGQGFPEPVFDGEFEILGSRVVGERHIKMRVRADGDDGVFDAIAFNQASECGALSEGTARLVYRLGVNDYGGMSRLQLVVEWLEHP